MFQLISYTLDIMLLIFIVILIYKYQSLTTYINEKYKILDKKIDDEVYHIENIKLPCVKVDINENSKKLSRMEKFILEELSYKETAISSLVLGMKKLEREVFGEEQNTCNVSIKEEDDKNIVIIDKD